MTTRFSFLIIGIGIAFPIDMLSGLSRGVELFWALEWAEWESNLTSHLVMPVGPVVAAFRAPVLQVMSYAVFLSTSDMR